MCSFLKRTDQGEKPLSEHLARLNSLVKREIKVRFLSTLLNINNMTIINKYTGRDVSSEFLALMQNEITNDEFELITMTIK